MKQNIKYKSFGPGFNNDTFLLIPRSFAAYAGKLRLSPAETLVTMYLCGWVKQGTSITLKVSHQALASQTGLTRQTVYKTISKFEKKGWIKPIAQIGDQRFCYNVSGFWKALEKVVTEETETVEDLDSILDDEFYERLEQA